MSSDTKENCLTKLKKINATLCLIKESPNLTVVERKELTERIEILENSLEKLEKFKNHKLLKYEILYQSYRVKFSKAYFKMSDTYKGDSLIEYIQSRPCNDCIPEYISGMLMYSFLKTKNVLL